MPDEWPEFKLKSTNELFARHLEKNSKLQISVCSRERKVGRKRPLYCELHESMILKPPNDKPPVADHDHKSGKYRGWLCNVCNAQIIAEIDRLRNLGIDADDIKAFFQRAVDYVFTDGKSLK